MLEKILEQNKKDISGIIQVGANIGQEVSLISKFTENIYLFEPLKEIYSDLVENCKDYKNVKTFNYALGSIEEKRIIYVSDVNKSASSSLLKPTGHLNYFPEVSFSHQETIEVRRFDKIDINFIGNLLIMDVQGYELEVLKGFGDKLKQIQYIYTEVSLKELYEQNILLSDLDKFLNINGFTRVSTKIFGNIPQGDAFYKKIKDKRNIMNLIYNFKSKVQISIFYRLISLIKDREKIVFLLKKRLKGL